MLNYKSRKEIVDKYHEDFNINKKSEIDLLDPASKDLYSVISKISEYNPSSVDLIDNAIKRYETGTYKSLGDFMKKQHNKLVKLLVHKEEQDKYYYIIDKYKQFQYSEGTNRRSVRSNSYSYHMKNAFKLIYNYYLFGFFECSMANYLINNMAEDKLDIKTNYYVLTYKIDRLDDMIAAGIDFGDRDLINAIQEIILSENNTEAVTVHIIRGVLKSSNEELHKLLGDFLLAARLQEGIRQAICENADCGTTEGFLKIFEVICDNNLIRYSSIKRAVATWIGICDENNVDRISNKIISLMSQCILDKDIALKKTESNDSIEIMVGLWALGFYDVEDAIEVMKKYVSCGSRNQKLTMSYYNLDLYYKKFSDITANKMIEDHWSDYELIAAFMPTYLSSVEYYLEVAINDKRNKDLLMSYSLIPIKDKIDLLNRYQFLQVFLKGSKQFGSQRRSSEALAVDMALENLAISAGFTDVTRLILMAEAEMINTIASFLSWNEVDGVSVRLEINKHGQPSLVYRKGDKQLKAAPASFRKNPYNLEIKQVVKKLKDQYSRTKQMFEVAMENRTLFTFSELLPLRDNPVISPIINNLVFIGEDLDTVDIGFLSDEGLLDYSGNEIKLDLASKIRVAHPFDLYKNRCWHEYQSLFFTEESVSKQRKQPFKQVFRELYIKLDEELENHKSLMFAGNQIQTKRTLTCLKNRKWVADYEEGLQKVYYRDNIVANIYALADWFSPSDIEAPTLEWVVFSNRKTFQSLKIKDVPDIVYSEIMRDVDMAVSVAHAGGVDPETSHSTIEMRKVIIEFNLPLFGIENVVLSGSHAIITGKRAEYNIHLASGIIHKAAGPMINVLPVHSQSRGKIFLPFIDEDPKTAEIMSKIVLFARDEKIKDPYILSQI